jgi:hypothetical protein
MRTQIVISLLTTTLFALPVLAQQTPPAMVKSYDTLADIVLSMGRLEVDFVRVVLDGHRHAAESLFQTGEYSAAAAQMALFANEGDNAMAGVRKRLLKGGHHHHSDAEAEGEFEPGYVIVSRQDKKEVLAASAELRQAKTDEARAAAWMKFHRIAEALTKIP